MLKNYFKIAIRSLWKHRFYSGLNIIGLAIGLAVSLILFLYVNGEMTFDQYHQQAANIYRIVVNVKYDDVKEDWARVPNNAGPTFKENIKEVVEQVRLLRHNFGRDAFINVDGKKLVEEDLYWVDSTFFNVFDCKLIQGDPATALNGPNKIIISESAAEKIFGRSLALGKRIKIDNQMELEITGVYEDFPSNSTLDCGMMGSFQSIKWASERLTWGNASFETFLLTQADTKIEDLNLAMNAELDKAVKKEEQWYSFWAQPFLDIHLYSSDLATGGYSVRAGDISQVRIMSLLALAVLLLACFNYINMATARSQQRFREVGINKTLGASNGQMVRRFLTETGILAAVSLAMSILLVQICLPYAESLMGLSLNTFDPLQAKSLLTLGGLWFLITVLAGFYPALFLSNFSPKKLLSPLRKPYSGNRFFRQTLVVGQFVICTALIIGIFVFQNQLNFINNKKLGFKAEQVLSINTSAATELSQIEGLKNAYRNLPEVSALSRMQGYPGLSVSGYTITKPGQEHIVRGIQSNRASADFEKVLSLKILAGKSLPEKKLETDTTIQVVMNETAVKFFGWTPEEAIGKTPPGLYHYSATEIVGVVEDFHFESFHNPIGAYVFNNGASIGRRPYLLVKLNTRELKTTIQKLEAEFNKYFPASAFEFDFLSDQTRKMYASEERMAQVISLFTFLTIFISCLGLFGLTAFTTERRTKEIGIRKVLGASVIGIMGLLSKDFLKLVLIAILIATPLAYYLLDSWLNNFAYRISIDWWVFVVAGAIALVLAFLTVSYQSMKAAMANPSNSLNND